MTNKPIVAIFLKDEDLAGKLAAELTRNDIEPMLSPTADEFHRVLNFQRVDLVVIDNELPGFLTGLEILERLNNDLLRPPTIFLAKLNSELQERTAALGVEKSLPPDVPIEELTTAITSALAIRSHNLV